MNYTFQFSKPFYKTKDLLEIFPISRSTFYLMQDKLTMKGRDLAEMGRMKINKCENVFWDPIKFWEYLKKEEINKPIKYNYDKQQQDEVNIAIGVFNNQQQQQQQKKEY